MNDNGKTINRYPSLETILAKNAANEVHREKVKKVKRIRRRNNSELSSEVCTAIREILSRESPQTVRQVFYQTVVLGVVEKTKSSYNKVQRLLLKMREDEEIPYNWITDNTRSVYQVKTYSSIEECLSEAADDYCLDLWADQDNEVMIFIEKDALAGTVRPVTSEYRVPRIVTRGFSSLSYAYEVSRHLSQHKHTFIYWLGDHDPSGKRIDPSIEAKLRKLAPDKQFTFTRLAVTPEQIVSLQLPSHFTKTDGNTHAKGWDGSESVELDAIKPQVLRDMVEERIKSHLDMDRYKATMEREKAERKQIKTMTSS